MAIQALPSVLETFGLENFKKTTSENLNPATLKLQDFLF